MRILKKFDTNRMGTLILDYEISITLNQIFYKAKMIRYMLNIVKYFYIFHNLLSGSIRLE